MARSGSPLFYFRLFLSWWLPICFFISRSFNLGVVQMGCGKRCRQPREIQTEPWNQIYSVLAVISWLADPFPIILPISRVTVTNQDHTIWLWLRTDTIDLRKWLAIWAIYIMLVLFYADIRLGGKLFNSEAGMDWTCLRMCPTEAGFLLMTYSISYNHPTNHHRANGIVGQALYYPRMAGDMLDSDTSHYWASGHCQIEPWFNPLCGFWREGTEIQITITLLIASLYTLSKRLQRYKFWLD